MGNSVLNHAAEQQPTTVAQPTTEAQPETEQPTTEAQPETEQPTTETQPEAAQPTAEAQPEAAQDTMAAMTARAEQLASKLRATEARAAALALGVPESRALYAVRMADLGEIDPAAEDAPKRIAEAIGKVVSDLPELRAAASTGAVGTGATGEHVRRTGAEVDPFERGLARR